MKKSILIVFLLCFYCCTRESNYAYQKPDSINDGLQVDQLHNVGIDTTIISNAVNKIANGKFGEVHSMLIYKNDKLVLEEYFSGHSYKWDAKNYHGKMVNWDKNMPHDQMSCTKSVTSALIAIAIDKGFIKSVNQSIFDYLPDHQHLKINKREYITIEHLVTMTSGLAWDEWSASHGTAANDIDALWFTCKETISCVLDRPWWQEPGELFTYNGGGMAILGEIIKNSSGMTIDEFSTTYLFDPLGVKNTRWTQFPGGVWDGSGAFYITPRAMLKFGVLYLNDGIWDEEQLIPKDWVKKSAIPFKNNRNIKIPGEDSGKNGYGYTWWTSKFSHNGSTINMFRAGGWGGQEIMVFPELDMVVVFTGGNYASKTKLFKIVENYILKSIK